MANKKNILALFLFLAMTAPCTHATAAPDDKDTPSQSAVCLGMCGDIQKLCAEDIAEGNVAGRDLKDGILDEASCLLMCEADWDDKTLNCVSAADSCSQFLDEAPYCIETEEKNEPTKPSVAGKGCAAACKNYAKCTGYGENVTPRDQAHAYDSCMQVCPTWTPATQKCIASTPIHSAADCAAQTMCMFGSMQNMVPPIPHRKK
ncbi:MAG: hypothetical protein AB7E77_11705 [Desulfobulbus sp.]